MVVTNTLLVVTVANPKANLKRPEFGFDLATKVAVNIRLDEVLMRIPDLFVQRLDKLLMAKYIIELKADDSPTFTQMDKEGVLCTLDPRSNIQVLAKDGVEGGEVLCLAYAIFLCCSFTG